MKKDCSKSFCDYCKKEVTETWYTQISLKSGFTGFSMHSDDRYVDLCKDCFKNLAPKELLEVYVLDK